MHFYFNPLNLSSITFFIIAYAHWLIIKSDEISLAENWTDLVMPSTWVNSVQKSQSDQESSWHSKMSMVWCKSGHFELDWFCENSQREEVFILFSDIYCLW